MIAAQPPVARRCLPDRRRQETVAVRWDGREWLVSAGLTENGYAGEVFLAGSKVGSAMDALAADAAVLMSLLLQHGVGAAELNRRLAHEGTDPGAPAASLIGLAARVVSQTEAKELAERHALAAGGTA